MKHLMMNDIVRVTGGKVLSQHHEYFDGIGHDTRVDLGSKCFIALKGEAFDAHQFLSQAVVAGATALIIHQQTPDLEQLKKQVTIIQVNDTLKALQQLAQFVRRQSSAVVIGIAGSNGKTSTKEFTKTLLSSWKKTHASVGSFNNHWGVPFTLLAQDEDTEFCIVEMGMNHKGELAELAKIAEPDVVVCTYVGVEHIEFFGNLEGIAEAEAEIYNYSPEQAVRIYNIDNKYTTQMQAQANHQFPKAKIFTFSQENQKADVYFCLKKMTADSLVIEGHIGGVKGMAEIPVFGTHNIINLMAAATIGLSVGMSAEQLWQVLPLCRTVWGRNQKLQTESGAQILFDAYNANPDSMKALVDNLRYLHSYSRRIGVFAEMKELGELSAQMHREVGEVVGKSALNMIWFYGQHAEDFVQGLRAAKFQGEIFISEDFSSSIAEKISLQLDRSTLVLVKGSRSMKLERFVRVCRPLNFSEKT